MSNQWLRLWHDMPTDPKWRTVARISKQRIGDVIAVYSHMLVTASNAAKRGNIAGWNDEDVASALDLETEQVTSIREAMQGRVLDGENLTGWEKRQPKREDNSSERVRAYRESKKIDAEKELNEEGQCYNNVTQCNAPDKDTDKENKEKKLTKKEINYPEAFLKFHELFPPQRKGSRENAFSAWKRATKRATEKEIFDGLEAYRTSPSVRDGYAKGAAAWLNDDGWKYQQKQYIAEKQKFQNMMIV